MFDIPMEREGNGMNRMLTTAFAALLLTFIVSRAISAPPAGDDDVRASPGRMSGQWTPVEWTFSPAYHDIKDYADRPDERTLNTLGVDWQDPELDALGNLCTVRGRVRMADNGQGRTQPITWFQGVTVYLGTTPGARPDWSRGMSEIDAVGETAVTSPTGKFHVGFDLRKTKYDRVHVKSFQFGVAMAKHIVNNKTSHEVVWNSRTPAIPATVQMLSVPAAPALSRELQLINRASRWPFSNPNGVELIRAVNALQPLGKERALTVLQKYAELTRSFDYGSDQEIVFWIIRLLFKPIRPEDRIPPPATGVSLDERPLRLERRPFVEELNWPLNPLAVSADVPFMVGTRVGAGSGQSELPSTYIDWARLHGVIRDGPLVPTANPVAAAETILESYKFMGLDDFSRAEATKAIRLQASAMVEGLLQPIRASEAARNDRWRALLRVAEERGIHWDAKGEQFVTRE
jgi:hypothetical protein